MVVDLKLNRMADMHGLLDNFAQAVVDDLEAQGIPDNDWDDETQADIDAARLEAAERLERLRQRIVALCISDLKHD